MATTDPSSLSARLAAASSFLLQSPPGEVNDCFNDVRAIVADDAAIEVGILPALEKYNTEQHVVVELDGKNVLITDASQLAVGEDGAQRHLDPRRGVSFAFDHMKLAASDAQPFPTDSETEKLRAELDNVFEAYVSNHYHDGVCAVYALPDPNYPPPVPAPALAPAPVVESVQGEEVAEAERVVVEEEVSAPAADAEEDKVEAEAGVEKAVEGEEPSARTEGEVPMAVDEDASDAVPVPTEETSSSELPNAPAAETEEPTSALPLPASEVVLSPVRSRRFGLYLVGNKYNPSNYWTGRWRAVYVADYAKGTLEGTVKINIHYYEQGNVQLSTTLHSSASLPSSSSSSSPSSSQAPSIIALLKSAEAAAQSQLADAYASLSDEAFRGLRRALPKTRSKLDWAKIAAYRLGNELGGAVGAQV